MIKAIGYNTNELLLPLPGALKIFAKIIIDPWIIVGIAKDSTSSPQWWMCRKMFCDSKTARYNTTD